MTPSKTKQILGHVEVSVGPVVTVRFAPNTPPPIFGKLTTRKGDALCVVRSFGDRVHAVAVRRDALWTPGMEIAFDDAPFLGSFDATTQGAVVAALRSPSGTAVAPSGIRAIEVFAPLVRDGNVGVFAEGGLGVTVLLPELAANLRRAGEAQTIFAFMPPLRDERHWRELAAETGPDDQRVSITFLPVDDPLATPIPDGLDAALFLSRRLAEQGVWPCLDPLESRSRLLQGEPATLAERLRTLYRDYYALQFGGERRALTPDEAERVRRGRKAIRLLGQPFAVAEPYTKTPGIYVESEAARAEFATILTGSPVA